MKIIAGDIGGTHSRFELFQQSGTKLQSLCQSQYENSEFQQFADVLQQFISEQQLQQGVDAAAFAIAGPVMDPDQVSLTNIGWQLERQSLQTRFAIGQLVLLNDFAAIAYGEPCIADSSLVRLQSVTETKSDTRVCAFIGAGTGLGQAVSVQIDNQTRVLASEGGHASFAPVNEVQRQLLDYYSQDGAAVDTEFFLSGRGLVHIYNALQIFNGGHEDKQLSTLDESSPIAISLRAQRGEPLAQQSVQVFWQIYAAHAGNVALQCLPYGGLYIAGGIAPKLLPMLDRAEFIEYFQNKVSMAPLLQQIPVAVIVDDAVARIGAAQYVLQAYSSSPV